MGEENDGSNDVGEIGDKFLIEIREPEEGMNSFDRGGGLPVFDSR